MLRTTWWEVWLFSVYSCRNRDSVTRLRVARGESGRAGLWTQVCYLDPSTCSCPLAARPEAPWGECQYLSSLWSSVNALYPLSSSIGSHSYSCRKAEEGNEEIGEVWGMEAKDKEGSFRSETYLWSPGEDTASQHLKFSHGRPRKGNPVLRCPIHGNWDHKWVLF